MSRMNIERLTMIKQKYGYVSQRQASQPRQNSNIRQRQHMFTRDESRINTPTPIAVERLTTEGSDRYAKLVISRPKQMNNESVWTFSNRQKPRVKLDFEASFGLSPDPRVFKQIPVLLNKQSVPSPDLTALKQSRVQPYERSYDLLQNYRKRIRSNYEQHRQSNKSTTIMETPISKIQQKQPCKRLNESSCTDQVQSKKHSKAVDCKQTDLLVSRQTRCSPLVGFQPKEVMNVEREMSNIEKIQQKIRSVLGVKNCR